MLFRKLLYRPASYSIKVKVASCWWTACERSMVTAVEPRSHAELIRKLPPAGELQAFWAYILTGMTCGYNSFEIYINYICAERIDF